jgi:hypothetical protein
MSRKSRAALVIALGMVALAPTSAASAPKATEKTPTEAELK